MKTVIIVFFMFISSVVLHSQTHWKVSTSFISFKIKNAGITVDGTFGGLIADIKFDGVDYLKSSLEASIDVNTINTGIDMRNNHLKKEEYFNVAAYPKIILKSSSIHKVTDGTFTGLFQLTMKGITKNITIPFSYSEAGNTAVFKSTFKLNRRDYSVGGNSWTMSDNVEITIVINCIK